VPSGGIGIVRKPKVSLARGKATLERLVEWFLN
jgi:hypothetical protein